MLNLILLVSYIIVFSYFVIAIDNVSRKNIDESALIVMNVKIIGELKVFFNNDGKVSQLEFHYQGAEPEQL